MRVMLAAGGGFLLAVLWFDLMFDVQALRARPRHGPLPEPALASIAGYYRRVTTDASPMGRLVAVAMLATLAAAVADLAIGARPLAVRVASLALLAAPISLALARTFRNAVRLGARCDPPERQSELARAIGRDHLLCLAGVLPFLALQLLSG